MSRSSDGAGRVRALLAEDPPVNMPGVYDALSARLAHEAGFEVLFISGYSVSATRLGMPDYGYLTQTETAAAARSVCDNTDRPVIVDADTGYGNALNTQRTARMLHDAGAAGIFLEDQRWPKRCGHFEGKQVVERDQWLTKLQAVLDLREAGVDLFLVARTDALAAESMDEAVARARAARDLGADAVFVEAPQSVDELGQVVSEVPDVVRVANMIEGGRTPLLDTDELSELGYDLIVTPLSGLLAATRALRETYGRLRDKGTLRDDRELLTPFDDFGTVVDFEAHREAERRYA